MAPTSTRCPTSYPVTPGPSSSMTPTGSWPMIRPGRTGYSPLRMWMSVPQIVVVVTRTTASPAAARGLGTDSTRMSFGPWKTVARIVAVSRCADGRVSVRVTADLHSNRRSAGRVASLCAGPAASLSSSWAVLTDRPSAKGHTILGRRPCPTEFRDPAPPRRRNATWEDAPMTFDLYAWKSPRDLDGEGAAALVESW